MNIFFLGDHYNPGGPNEVNKNLLSALKNEILYIKSTNPLLKRLERIYKIFKAKYIVCSGLYTNNYELFLLKLLRKKLIYIMHGCYFLETGNRLSIEEKLLKQSNLILCVSKPYREFISQKIYPQYSYKMKVLTNAINWDEYKNITNEKTNRDSNRIILIGGGRILKRNLQVCKAVQNINIQKGRNYHVDVYGYFRENDDSKKIKEIPCVTFHNVIPHTLLLNELQKSILFVQNSDFESFSLGVIEAIICGCNILISKNVGARDIIKGITQKEIINDTMNINEIQEKIEYILNTPNNKRLLDSIDPKTTTIQYSAEKLLTYIKNL